MEERGLKISRRKTEYLGCKDAEIQLQRESEDIHIPGIDVGGGWRTGCGSHPPSHSGWMNGKRVSGVLCDRRMNMKITG